MNGDPQPNGEKNSRARRRDGLPGLGFALIPILLVVGGLAISWATRSYSEAEGNGISRGRAAGQPRDAFLVLSYDDFGPSVASSVLLGDPWYQWEPHGHDEPYDYNIKVVVHREGQRQEAEARFPIVKGPVDYGSVDEAADFRYVECGQAIAHLKKIIARIGLEDGLDELLARLRQTLGKIEAYQQSRAGAADGAS
ncbi:MAG: hypothetical protein JXL80_03175 [Planctomycetes bacterium]|nr:hypothetical protein [Planctomycetota bacterium]